jgi:hypothetical protein
MNCPVSNWRFCVYRLPDGSFLGDDGTTKVIATPDELWGFVDRYNVPEPDWNDKKVWKPYAVKMKTLGEEVGIFRYVLGSDEHRASLASFLPKKKRASPRRGR